MKIAIMQPYLFPYIGYFQLIAAVDVFVLYDDVHYIKKGWINRNRILLNGAEHTFTLPCLSVSQNKLIKDIEVDWSSREIGKVVATMETAYRKAPFFEEVIPLVKEVLMDQASTSIADVAATSIKQVCSYLNIKTTMKNSSTGGYGNAHLHRGERIVDIVLQEKGDRYLNAIGGLELYRKDHFAEHGIILSFLNPLPEVYPQPSPQFTPWLSIIDVLMYNDKETVSKLLTSYELL
ncbi:WbqC family protein [Rufibacter sediminis]|uniref:WbqC family protein n=1 Tax=Rufibacter sediminis TaxID=2762756 RepID=A0ABR6VNT5_9BACT|nr:WbqC family protein [Rufibacter sediminis]MBC3538796.1 WbqC family protein [Rufibacter sediminis]